MQARCSAPARRLDETGRPTRSRPSTLEPRHRWRSSLRNRGFVALWLAVVCLWAIPAWGKGAAPAVVCQQRPECIDLALRAKRAEQLQQHADAFELYARAYDEFGDPRLLVFVSKMSLLLGRPAQAAQMLRIYLDLQPDPPSSKMMQTARLLLQAAEAAQKSVSVPAPVPSAKPGTGALSTKPAEPGASSSASSASTASAGAVPSAVGVSDIAGAAARKRRGRPAWRVALGVSLAVVAGVSVGAAIGLSVLHGRPAEGECSAPGALRPDCQNNFTPLFVGGYALSGTSLLGAGLTLLLP